MINERTYEEDYPTLHVISGVAIFGAICVLSLLLIVMEAEWLMKVFEDIKVDILDNRGSCA